MLKDPNTIVTSGEWIKTSFCNAYHPLAKTWYNCKGTHQTIRTIKIYKARKSVKPKDILIFGIDGITVQHVGEIVFDMGSTFEDRYASRHTYKQSLEDFAASVLFGDNIAVSGRLPKVKGENPGSIALEQMADIHTNLEISTTKTPQDILKDTYYREKVLKDIGYMKKAIFGVNKIFWQDLMRREAIISIGSHDTVYNSNVTPDEIVFDGAPHYVVDRELQNKIDRDSIITILATELQKYCDTRITKIALEEFVSRIILTHITIYWWYEFATIEAGIVNRVRIPHITRAVVRNEELKNIIKFSNKIPGTDRLIRQVFVQNALFEVLSLEPTRNRVLENLNILRNLEPYNKIRLLWREIIYETSQEIQSAKTKIVLDAILDEIRGKSKSRSNSKLQLDIDLNGFRANCWEVLKQIGGSKSKEYNELIHRVFPEITSET